MKKLLALLALLFAGTLLVTGCSSSPDATPRSAGAASQAAGSVQTVDPQAWLQASTQTGTTIVDVRTAEEYAAGHVQGAVNINVEGPTFAADIDKLDKAGTYAVYCHSGRRSAFATEQMAGAGFTSIVNLQGGIADLQAAGAPIVTGS